MPDEENPFENVPDEYASEAVVTPKIKVEKKVQETEEIEPETTSVDFEDLELPPYAEDKSKLAMAAGVGFVFLAVIFYLGIVMDGRFMTYLYGLIGMILAALIAFFYMLDDLRIRPVKITERGTRFVAGILLAFLFLMIFIMVGGFVTSGEFVPLVYLATVIVLTNASFALFFYSMLWEE